MPHKESGITPETKKKRTPFLESLRILIDRKYFSVHPLRAKKYLGYDRKNNFSNKNWQIPVGRREWVHYFGKAIGEVSDRPIHSYQTMLFPDEYVDKVYEPGTGYSVERFLTEADRIATSESEFGGYDEAFQAGKVVLDIASGEAIALMQLAMNFPDTTFIGVDQLYQKINRVYPNRTGLQLSFADWHTLDCIPSGSVDTILSVQGVAMWGLPIDGDERHMGNGISHEDGFKIIKTLNRISKPGTVLRFDINNEFLSEHLGENWQQISGPYLRPFVAKRLY